MKFKLFAIIVISLIGTLTMTAQEQLPNIINNAPVTSNGQSVAVMTNYVPNSADPTSIGTFYSSSELASSGFFGATLITGTTTVVGDWHAIQVLEDAVIDSLVSTKLTGDPHTLPLSAGTTLLLNGITRIKLTSGTVWAYKSK